MGRYPWAEVALFEALHIIALYPTRHHVHRVVVLAAMMRLAAKIYPTPEVTDPLWVTYAVGFMIAFRFTFTAYLLWAEGPFPDSWRRVRDEVQVGDGADGSDNLPSNFPLTKKLWWMLDIAYSDRMVGWTQEPRNCLPSHPPPSRKIFLIKICAKFAINIILTDLSTLIFAQSPAFDSRVHSTTDGPENYLSAIPLRRRPLYILGFGIKWAVGSDIIHNLVALICVGLGRSSPSLWPDICGRWVDSYTVSRFWGLTWHQRLRPAVAGLGRLVANKLLKFPRGTVRSSCTQLYIAFFLSGAIHCAADFMLEKRVVYRSFKFFLLQPVAIIFENIVIRLTKRLLLVRRIELKSGRTGEVLIESVVRGIGYCWVILWFCLTLPVLMDEASSVGLNNTDRWPISQFLLDKRNRWA